MTRSTLHSLRRAAMTFCLLGVAGSCGDGSGRPPVTIGLEEVGRYGWEAQRNGDGSGVLGGVTDVVEGIDQELFVLDQRGEKIAVFRSNGDVARTIPLPSGEGPGEYRIARDLTMAPGGNLAVLDNSLSRVVVLTPTGTLVDMVSLRVGGPLQLAFAQGKLWTSHSTLPGEDRPTLRSWSLDPLIAVDAISLSGIDRDFGGSGDLQVGPDGSLFRNLRIPGVWLKIGAGGARRMGVQLIEDLEPPVVTRNSASSIRIEQPRAWSDGIGVAPDGTVLQSYIELPSHPRQKSL